MLWHLRNPRGRTKPASFIEPCLAVEAEKPPKGAGWLHEIKHDGYRMQLRKSGVSVRLFTRRGFDWTERYPWVIEAAAKLKADSLTIDGELVCVDNKGIADFAKLHSRCFDGEAFLYGFDLLEPDGEDWRARPLIERKDKLAATLRRAPPTSAIASTMMATATSYTATPAAWG